MDINWKIMVGDLLFFACIGFAVYRWNYDNATRLKYFWSAFSLYLLIKQVYKHFEYFKETKRIY
jgi:hypothetical protein